MTTGNYLIDGYHLQMSLHMQENTKNVKQGYDNKQPRLVTGDYASCSEVTKEAVWKVESELPFFRLDCPI